MHDVVVHKFVGSHPNRRIRNFRVRMIFRDIAFEVYPFFNHDCYTFISGISNYFCSTSDFSSYSNV